MEINRLKPIDQTSDYMQDLALKNGTTISTCGYITCAICQYLSEQSPEQFSPQKTFKSINQYTMTPYIQKVMKSIANHRKLQVKKFYTKMNQSQRKNYLKDWVANHQVSDYLQNLLEDQSQKAKTLNPRVYFFRQVAYDHPQALETIKFQQKERVQQQQPFKGQEYFYTSFFPKRLNHFKCEFEQQLKEVLQGQKNQGWPLIIATDVLGHFNVTVLYKGQIYILDSLPFVQKQYDNNIVETIKYYYKKSYLKNQKE